MTDSSAAARRARAIAFYLPQFHPIPENDRWWGKGFTEWTNVARAKPLFRGHYQPHIPADLGFYDLRVPETRQAQADLAAAYGIEGFCYYHYWFGGRRILERPFEEVLTSGKPDFPFCLCWANHSWNSAWQGTPDRVLIEQVYPGMDDHAAHFDYLLRAFEDPRYIRVDGRPLFLIYKPDDIPDLERVVSYWRYRARAAGLGGLHLVGISHRSERWDPRERGLDACAMQALPVINGRIPRRHPLTKLKAWLKGAEAKLSIYDYARVLGSLLRQRSVDFDDYPIALPNWDNTPRSGWRGLVLQGSTPELFRQHFRDAVARVADRDPEKRLVFIKAWNEWAEGNHLEPDLRYGHGYLEAIRAELVAGRALEARHMKVDADPLATSSTGSVSAGPLRLWKGPRRGAR
ncbi:glycosyltransferase WbsX family protein [Spiribacter halobius]|uniref:Lipopolysaccharide biosynthesis protein n=1 Tax=Sediminicurvatus halobius TaxID=2182432 RepID=A0A2U2MYA7_9GAMM|nr:glycoside hydrolase family 99-like domain-containing protein [Spiribacter halobius]PWG61709.1 lipopolysaccharide biosynthesis protein [Spiribacter halobius]UEX77332.1 glycoside hydrolase family 99-like domain-containing protein [Spiribacter halobius]